MRLGDDPLQDALIETGRQHRVEQRSRVAAVQRLDPKLSDAPQRVHRLPPGKDHRDPLRQQAARHKREHAGRRTIEPLSVVDEA